MDIEVTQTRPVLTHESLYFGLDPEGPVDKIYVCNSSITYILFSKMHLNRNGPIVTCVFTQS
jgi:hypothetical protein